MKNIQGTDSVLYQPIVKNTVNDSVDYSSKELATKLSEKQKNDPFTVDEKRVADSVEKLNEAVNIIHKNLKFQLDKQTNTMFVKVINSDTGDVIKQIPPKEILEMEARIQKMVGLILDEKI